MNKVYIVITSLLFASIISLVNDCKAKPQKANIVRSAEDYFNNMKTLKSKFVQINPDGSTSKGDFFLQRPGKFRLDYTNPDNLLLVSDGVKVTNYDKDLDAPTYLPIESVPAYVLLTKDVNFSGDVTVTETIHEDHYVYLSLAKTDDPQNGSLTLVFQKNPYKLKKWIVTDADGNKTLVELTNPQINVKLESDLFKFSKY